MCKNDAVTTFISAQEQFLPAFNKGDDHEHDQRRGESFNDRPLLYQCSKCSSFKLVFTC